VLFQSMDASHLTPAPVRRLSDSKSWGTLPRLSRNKGSSPMCSAEEDVSIYLLNPISILALYTLYQLDRSTCVVAVCESHEYGRDVEWWKEHHMTRSRPASTCDFTLSSSCLSRQTHAHACGIVHARNSARSACYERKNRPMTNRPLPPVSSMLG
jgi:hypothetical protein